MSESASPENEETPRRASTPTLYQEEDDGRCACSIQSYVRKGMNHFSAMRCDTHRRYQQERKSCGCQRWYQQHSRTSKWLRRNAYCPEHIDKYFLRRERLEKIRLEIKTLKKEAYWLNEKVYDALQDEFTSEISKKEWDDRMIKLWDDEVKITSSHVDSTEKEKERNGDLNFTSGEKRKHFEEK